MDNRYKLIVDSFGREKFKFDEPLKGYMAHQIGGRAKLFFIAFQTQELIKIITMCRDLKLPFLIFGSGSKIMISDAGYAGLAIKNRTKDIQTLSVKGKVTKIGIGVEEALVEVDSGVSINKFCEYLDSQKLDSRGFSGIPGSIGGNIFWNRFLQTSAKSIKILDQVSETLQIRAEELSPKKHIVLSAVFKIKAK